MKEILIFIYEYLYIISTYVITMFLINVIIINVISSLKVQDY